MPVRNLLTVLLLALSFGSAQTLTIPQVADGGGWQTTLVLTNTGASATTASLSFFQSVAGGATVSWTPPFLETSSLQNMSLPAAGVVFLHTPGTAGATSEGWAKLQANAAVVAYAIFTWTNPGQLTQYGTAPAAAGTSRALMPFDNTNGLVTSMALVNTTSASETISAGMQPASGQASQLPAITLPANGYMAFTLPQQFPTTAGQHGLLEFYSATGDFSLVALLFNQTAFTTSPVYGESGAPIIVTSASSTAGFDGIYTGTYTASGITGSVTATIDNGTITINNPGSGSGTVTSAGQIAFGVDITEGAYCTFSGTVASTGVASGSFSCASPTITGTWSMTRQ
jgi:hypothetical protein